MANISNTSLNRMPRFSTQTTNSPRQRKPPLPLLRMPHSWLSRINPSSLASIKKPQRSRPPSNQQAHVLRMPRECVKQRLRKLRERRERPRRKSEAKRRRRQSEYSEWRVSRRRREYGPHTLGSAAVRWRTSSPLHLRWAFHT